MSLQRPATEVALVDAALPDLALLLAGIRPDIEVRLLGSGDGGIAAIRDALSSGFDAVHVVGHGAPGQQFLGGDILDCHSAAALSGRAGTDLLLYGCCAGAEDAGRDLVSSLAQALPDGSVAAASRQIGDASIGGTWELDVAVGGRRAASAFSAGGPAWPHVLEVIAGTAGNDTLIGTAAQDMISAGGGDDVVQESDGGDDVDGGAGFDIATFGTGIAGQYAVVPDASDTLLWTVLRSSDSSVQYIVRQDAVTSTSWTVENVSTSEISSLANVELLRFDGEEIRSSAPPSAPVDADTATNAISEDVVTGATVGITASSTDADPGAVLTYSLIDDAGGRFVIDAVTGVVTVASAALIDFEAASSHQITVRVTDDTGQISDAAYTIEVLDTNEAPAAPTDNNGDADMVVEGAAAGAMVGITAAAIDPDLGDTITYSLTDDAGGRFTIDATTGVVTVASGAVIDYEAAQSHAVTVRATDAAGLYAEESFTIAVGNVPDAAAWTGTAGDDSFSASTADFWLLSGLDGDDRVTGNVLADTLIGGAGDDTLDGNDGDDLFHVTGSDDGFDSVIGGAGTDIIEATADGAVIGLRGLSGIEAITAAGFANVKISGSSDADALDFAAVALTGITLIDGGDGNDTIVGSAGDDVVVGGAGADLLSGGDGTDTLSYENASGVSVDLAAGTGAGSEAAGDQLNGFENVIGSDQADTLIGDAGGNLLSGGEGDDSLAGGDGDDRFRFAGAAAGFDAIAGGDGADTIEAAADGTVIGLRSIAGIEAITSGGFANVAISGDASANALDFTAAVLTGIIRIEGGDGDDSIAGSAGDDVILGGVGADLLAGGDGIDTLSYANAAGVAVNLAAGTATGSDATGDQFSGFENLAGSDQADTLVGDAGANMLAGNGGNDDLDGGDGDDRFRFAGASEGFDTVVGGAGIDTIEAAAHGTVIGLRGFSGIEAVTAAGYANVTISGDGAANTLNFATVTLTGIALINGGDGNDTITGSSGDDVIMGSTGADSMIGGSGIDTLSYANAAGGVTVVLTTTTGTGAGSEAQGDQFSGFENVIGSEWADSLRGNLGDNVIFGGGGNDTIYGRDGGADTLIGGAGDDILTGSTRDNVYRFSGTNEGFDYITDVSGSDTIEAAANGTVIGLSRFTEIETITANGFSNVILAGGDFDNSFDLRNVNVIGIHTFDLGDGSDLLWATNLADTIIGGGGHDVMVATGGDDLFLIGLGSGFDDFLGGVGYDEIRATANNVVIGVSYMVGDIEVISAGGFANVTVRGDGGDNLIAASMLIGITLIDGGAGSDDVRGAAGNDMLTGGAGDDAVYGGDGDDVILFSGTDAGFDIVNGGAGNDRIQAMMDNTVIGLQSLPGVETITGNGFANVSIRTTAGNDTLNFSAVTLSGIARIEAGAGFDRLTGSTGADVMLGGTQDDVLDGGGGDDMFLVGPGDGFDAITGGSGNDTVQASIDNTAIGLGSLAGVEMVSAAGFANVTITAGNVDFSTVTLTGITRIDGTASGNIITGSAAGDTIAGGAGDDQLNGGGGDDLFLVTGTGDGFDRVLGGSGTDRIEAQAAGTTIGLTGLSDVEVISGNGYANVGIRGSAAAENFDFSLATLTGVAWIEAGSGNDTLVGSAGDEVFRVSGAFAGIDAISGGAGTDRIEATSVNTIIGLSTVSGIETITANGYSGVTIQGSANADSWNLASATLIGIANMNSGAGNDTIIATDGNDTISGGTDQDSLDGGAGDDVFLVSGSGGYDIVMGGAGYDRIEATAANTLIGLQSLSGVEAISGGSFAGVIIWGGNYPVAATVSLDFSNVVLTGIAQIQGSDGNDTITGSAGDDVIMGGFGVDILAGGAGVDTLSYTGFTLGITANMTTGIVVQGDVFSGFENLIGTSLADTLTGDAGDNLLSGAIGNDILEGGAGADTLDGGAGTDTVSYAGAASGVSVDLLTGLLGGAAAGDSLIAVEYATGSAFADSLTGNALGNILTGGAGDDILDGGAGTDQLVGGAGNDLYFADVTAEAGGIIELVNEGIDEVRTTASSFTLNNHVEILTFIGAGAFAGSGSAQDNSILGADGADTLRGLAGSDNLTGGLGADLLAGGAGKDVLAGGAGADVFDFDAIAESGIGAAADLVADFAQADGDRIDLSTIDAYGTGTNGAFTFIGTAAFASAAFGQLRYEVQGDGNTHIFGDTNGNAVADFEIVLAGSVTLTVTDFIL